MISRDDPSLMLERVDEALLRHPAVAKALAFCRPSGPPGAALMAAVVLRDGATISEPELLRHAATLLDPAEHPAQIVVLSALPDAASRALQRSLLAERFGVAAAADGEAELEELLAALVGEVLGKGRPDREENLFLYGVDSLQGHRLITRLEQALGLRLRPTLLFDAPTLRSLAVVLSEQLDQALASSQPLHE